MQNKTALMEAFRKRLEYMPYDRIKVTDLCTDCNVNRQTFYYHFRNMADLAARFIQSEAERLLRLDDDPFTWEDKIRALIEYLDRNREMCLSLLTSMEHSELRRIIASVTEQLIVKIAGSTGPAGDAAILDIPGDEREFYIKFYSLAVSGLVESWIMGDIQMSPERLIGYIERIISRRIAAGL